MKRSREPEEDTTTAEPPPPATSSSSPRSPAERSENDRVSPPAAKITELDPSAHSSVEMRCSLPPHKESLVFPTYEEYEAHYHKTHSNRCLECRKNLPSAHLLGIHVEEMHDPFALVRRERGERTYSCFVEGCDRKCSTPQKRRMHLIDKHMYPKNFFFAITRDGIDGRRSLLLEGGHRRRRSSVAAAAASAKAQATGQGPVASAKQEADADKSQPKEVTAPNPEQKPDVVMDGLAGAMSALQFVPPSVRFGRGGRKAGFAKR